MKRIPLGKSDLQVSVLCLGTHNFGAHPDALTCERMLDTYVAGGGNFLDTANIYQTWHPGHDGGESESFLGTWMRKRRNRHDLVVATKCGGKRVTGEKGLRAAQIEFECDLSLGRLQTDTIDLYLAHFDDEATPLEETLGAFEKLRRAGKVRALGLCNYRADRLESAISISQRENFAMIACLQMKTTWLPAVNRQSDDPWLEPRHLQVCADHAIAVTSYSVQVGGAYQRDDKKLPDAVDGPRARAQVAWLREFAAAHDATPANMVMAWCLHHAPPIIPLFTASSPAQVEETLSAAELQLIPGDMQALDEKRLEGVSAS